AEHAASPPTHTGTRGSLAVAKFKPFVPSLLPTLYRRALLLNNQNAFWFVVSEWRIVYRKLVGTPATAVAASAGRLRLSRIRPRITWSARRTRRSLAVVPRVSASPFSA